MTLIHLEITEYGGRGFFANSDIPENTTILNCSTPLTFNIFRKYKKDACAYCFSCDFHKSCKFKLDPKHQVKLIERLNTELGKSTLQPIKFSIPSSLVSQTQAFGGLFFCSEICKDEWIVKEDPTGLISFILNSIDQAVPTSKKTPVPENVSSVLTSEINSEFIQKQWNDALGVAEHITISLASQQLNLSTTSIPSSTSSSPAYSLTPVTPTTPNSPISLTSVISDVISDTDSEPKTKKSYSKKSRSKNKNRKVPAITSEEQDIVRFVAVLVVKMFLKSFGAAVLNKDEAPLMSAFCNETSDDGFQYFGDLQSNEELHLKTLPDMLEIQIKVFMFLNAVLPLQLLPFLTQKIFRDILGREAANAFGIWQLPITPDSELLGSSLYPYCSFFNHACSHNVRKVRSGRRIIFQTNRLVKAGEQLYINYGMYNDMPYKERHEQLKNQWYFDCQCDRCLSERAQI
ncbi:uncharacterized protein SAPINGB_P003069 [Magnusiomyces paraingens]|uniref:SET domain-containing protein n=1 Tax=Magnusiomyces paraingens TaxID=2606893 RepID=A0A5E8BI50_9ASCO|nr:uncharacterized protein SAPINGB_P003069 [Saprochaete ingens]VVT51356.1 unnamed protein product [Saprochaete ingens]